MTVKGNDEDVWAGSKCVKKNTPHVQKSPRKSVGEKGRNTLFGYKMALPAGKYVER